MQSEVPEFRRTVGVLMRFPVVAILGLFWTVYVWSWIAGGCIVLSVILLILQPVLYPILWLLNWLLLAFGNSADKVLPNYWTRYPDVYFELVRDCLKLGFPTLRRWLLEGWQ
jgi:hypothetical protein